MAWLDFLRWTHIIGAAVILGTGTGIAFFMLMAHRTNDANIIAHTAGVVVRADWIFTATAVVAQPITGILLAAAIGWRLTEPWIVASLALYVVVGGFWLPVVWIQYRIKTLARAAAAEGASLPASYFRLFRIWASCGVPAFIAVLVIVWIMIARPTFA